MKIPVVFSTNDSYVAYLGVALQSLKMHSNAEHDYRIYILYTRLSEVNIRKLKAMEEKNLDINFINVSSFADNIPFKMSRTVGTRHITVETYYRIFIPEIIKNYNKIVYLDCDLVLCRDVADLLNTDLKGNPVGAVCHADYWVSSEAGDKGNAKEEVFNAGVLLIDSHLYKEYRIMEKFIELAETGEEFAVNDQDMLRKILINKVTYLDNHWNVPWYHFQESIFSQRNSRIQNALEEVKKDPWIVHFANRFKPWEKPHWEMAEYFWQYARNTIFYEEIIYRNFINGKMIENHFENYLFPFDRIARNSNIVLYAAGDVGQAFYNQIKLTGYCNCVLWVDLRFKNIRQNGLPVFALEEINKVDFDVILIAVKNAQLADDIQTILTDMGILKNKIIWSNPVK